MNINKYQQRGMSGTTIAAVLFLLVFGLTIFFKLFPLYMDNMKIEKVLKELVEYPKLAQKPSVEIERLFLRSLSEKDIRTEKDVRLFDKDTVKQVLSINRNSDAGTVELTLKYNREAKFQGNLFFLVKFETIAGTP